MPERFAELVRLMARLRALDGCPWDRKQTHDSLKPYLIEETYEVLETITSRMRGNSGRSSVICSSRFFSTPRLQLKQGPSPLMT